MHINYKLIVTDIDGTLANGKGEMADADVQALQKLYQQGVKISLCTGRPAGGCRKFLRRLNMDGFHICFDGALITDSTLTETVYGNTVAKNLLEQIYNLSVPKGLALELFSHAGFYVERRHALADSHSNLLSFPYDVTDLRGIIEREPVILACVVIDVADEKEILSLFEPMKRELSIGSTSSVVVPEVRFINITAQGNSKGTALTALTGHLGVTKEEVIAIGDGTNDIPLLEGAGLGIAMGNAPDELKKVADFVTGDVENHGLAAAVKRVFPDIFNTKSDN